MCDTLPLLPIKISAEAVLVESIHTHSFDGFVGTEQITENGTQDSRTILFFVCFLGGRNPTRRTRLENLVARGVGVGAGHRARVISYKAVYMYKAVRLYCTVPHTQARGLTTQFHVPSRAAVSRLLCLVSRSISRAGEECVGGVCRVPTQTNILINDNV